MPGGFQGFLGGGGWGRGGCTKKTKFKKLKTLCDNYKSRQFQTWKSYKQTKTFYIC